MLANKTVVNSKKIGVPIEKRDTKITIPGMLHKIKTEPKHRYRSSPALQQKHHIQTCCSTHSYARETKASKNTFFKSVIFFHYKIIFLIHIFAIRSISTDAPTASPVTPIHVLAGSLSSLK